MSRDEALGVIEACADVPVAADTPIAGLGDDSLDLLFVVQEIEKSIEREIPNPELVAFRTAGDLAAWIEAHA